MGRARELANLFSGGSADINVKTSDGGILNLQTSDTTVTQDSVVGSIQFQAPDEASGTDAILVASKIEAIAEGTFSASSNATSLVFSTASSAAAGTVAGKMTFTSGGELVIKDTDTADGSSPTITLQSGDTDIAQDDVLGSINFQAPDEGTGTDAILVAAGIAAVSEGDFSSSSNATKLSFKTGSSEAAAEKMSLSSAGLLTVSDDIVIKSGGTIGGANDTDLLTLGNAALTVAGTIGGTAITASGRLITDDTTEATSTTDGSLQTDGGLSVAKDVVIGDDLKLLSDSSVIHFGADSEVTLTHVADTGLALKHTATADDKPIILTLQTGETDMAANDIMGSIQFQAPDEGTGTDAILVAAEIRARAEGDFAADNNATTLDFRTGSSEAASTKMMLNSNGNLSLGKDMAPSEDSGFTSFTLGGDRATTGSKLKFFDSSDNLDGQVYAEAGSIAIQGQGDVRVQSSGTHGMRIESDGQCTISRGDEGAGNNVAFLTISYSLGNNLGGVQMYTYSYYNDVNFKCTNNDTNGGRNHNDFQFERSGGTVGSISIGTGGTSFNTSSDYRLKEDEKTITDAIGTVKKLKPYDFKWKKTGIRQDGFFAHEVDEVLSYAVTGEKDAVMTKERCVLDKNGNVIANDIDKEIWESRKDDAGDGEHSPPGETTYPSDSQWVASKEDVNPQSVDQSKIVPVLTAALQEAITKIETLETKVKTLEEA